MLSEELEIFVIVRYLVEMPGLAFPPNAYKAFLHPLFPAPACLFCNTPPHSSFNVKRAELYLFFSATFLA